MMSVSGEHSEPMCSRYVSRGLMYAQCSRTFPIKKEQEDCRAKNKHYFQYSPKGFDPTKIPIFISEEVTKESDNELDSSRVDY